MSTNATMAYWRLKKEEMLFKQTFSVLVNSREKKFFQYFFCTESTNREKRQRIVKKMNKILPSTNNICNYCVVI